MNQELQSLRQRFIESAGHFTQSLGAGRVLARMNAITAGLGVVLLVVAATGAGGFIGILLPLFGYVASLGLIFPNAAALALAPHGEHAGSASALLGTVQFGAAAIASILVGLLHDGSALPLAGVIAGCGILALVAQRALVPMQARQG